MNSNGTLSEMRSIVKLFFGVCTLDGIDLAVRPSECVGLHGKNDAGKSTLMKMLLGAYPYGTFEGEILWEGEPLRAHSVRDSKRAGIVIIHQELVAVQQPSVMENVFLGGEITKPEGRMGYDAIHTKAEELLAHLRLADVNVATPVMNYGSGHRQLLGITRALAKNARLLILDEPTSPLSAKKIEVLLPITNDPKHNGVTCVYVSRKLDEIKHVCDTTTVIRDDKHTGTRPVANMTTDNIIMMMVSHEATLLFPKMEHTVGDMVMGAHNVTY